MLRPSPEDCNGWTSASPSGRTRRSSHYGGRAASGRTRPYRSKPRSEARSATGSVSWSISTGVREASSISPFVRSTATISPLSASMPMCSFRQDLRREVLCFSTSQAPAPPSFSPVLSTSTCNGPVPNRPRSGTANVLDRRLKVELSGAARSRPSSSMREPTSPSVCRNASGAGDTRHCRGLSGKMLCGQDFSAMPNGPCAEIMYKNMYNPVKLQAIDNVI